MTQRTLLPGFEEVVCVPRMTAAKEGEGLVMVSMSGKQVVAAVAAVVVGIPGTLMRPYLPRKRRCAQ